MINFVLHKCRRKHLPASASVARTIGCSQLPPAQERKKPSLEMRFTAAAGVLVRGLYRLHSAIIFPHTITIKKCVYNHRTLYDHLVALSLRAVV